MDKNKHNQQNLNIIKQHSQPKLIFEELDNSNASDGDDDVDNRSVSSAGVTDK